MFKIKGPLAREIPAHFYRPTYFDSSGILAVHNTHGFVYHNPLTRCSCMPCHGSATWCCMLNLCFGHSHALICLDRIGNSVCGMSTQCREKTVCSLTACAGVVSQGLNSPIRDSFTHTSITICPSSKQCENTVQKTVFAANSHVAHDRECGNQRLPAPL